MNRQMIDPIHPRKHDVAISNTTQQVRDQLAIISKLRRQNDDYLTRLEKDWIDSIIASARTVIERFGIRNDPTIEREEPQRTRLKSAAFLRQIKNTIQASPIAAQNLTQLLIVAQTLNSATSLLSCCYERHKWSTRQMRPIPLIEEDFNTDLAQLLDRRHRRSRRNVKGQDRVSQLVRIASTCLQDSEASDTMSNKSEELHDTIHNHTGTMDANIVLDQSGPEEMLSLIIVESIDNWKRNAEMALETATQQSSPSDTSKEFHVQSKRSSGQHDRYNSTEHTIAESQRINQEKHCTKTSQATPEQTYTALFRTISEQRHPQSDYLEKKPSPVLNQTHSHQSNSLSRLPLQDYSTPEPWQATHLHEPTTTTTIPETQLHPLPDRDAHLDPLSRSSSIFSERSSSNVVEGMTVSPGIARLVYLPKTSPPSAHEGLTGLHITRGCAESSLKSKSSDTTICSTGMSSSWAHRRVSRGRAWLERQDEIGIA